MQTSHYPPTGSPYAEKLATFAEQMADFARGEQLRALRDGRRLSQEDAAHEIGVSTKALRAWEKGGKIKWENAKAAGTFYGVDPESLVTRETTEQLPVLASQTQLERIEIDLASMRVELGELAAGLATVQQTLEQIRDTAAEDSRSRQAK